MLGRGNPFVRNVKCRQGAGFFAYSEGVRRSILPFAVAATLLALLGLLGTLQYRWLGEVSNAERDRLRATLRARATDFGRDFDRELTGAYLAFRADTALLSADPASALADAFARAQGESSVGGIIKSVYVFDVSGDDADGTLRLLDPASRTLTATPWPADLEQFRRRPARPFPSGLGLPGLIGDAIDPAIPALVVSLPAVKRLETDGHFTIVRDTAAATRVAILRLDAERLQRQLLAQLVARHFGVAAASEYHVAVVSRAPGGRVIYASSPEGVTPANADVAAGLFDLRLDELQPLETIGAAAAATAKSSTPPMKDRVSVTIVRRAQSDDAAHVMMTRGDGQGAWQVLVRGKAGSLEAVVARSRNRNVAVGLGILAVLAASLVFVIGSAQRQHRLAQQQMEFVAAVSHELRTPLAVIRSAGENLADGVVTDAEQVKTYGSLVRSEGRRLSDMVERVMEFAGVTAAAPLRTRDDVDLAEIVSEAVNGVAADARERGVTVTMAIESGLPPLAGDPEALRSAVQNVIANAIKYSRGGGAVEASADRDGDRVRVVVTDRGIGIDAEDLPHVFKPFYRGRRAVDAQIRGTGVGLSVVRRVVDRHHGHVTIESRAGEGTRVVLTFPAGARSGSYAPSRETARVTT